MNPKVRGAMGASPSTSLLGDRIRPPPNGGCHGPWGQALRGLQSLISSCNPAMGAMGTWPKAHGPPLLWGGGEYTLERLCWGSSVLPPGSP